MGNLDWPDAELRAAFLSENLSALGVSALTVDLIHQAASAEVVEAEPGIDVISVDGALLGAPADDWGLMQTCQNAGRAPVVVFGLGTGDTVRSVQHAFDGPVVVYEPDARVARAVLERGPTDLGNTELICSLRDLSQIWAALARDEVGATLVRTPGYRERFPDEHAELERLVSELVHRTGINRNTHQQRARTWIEDLFANIGSLKDEVPLIALRNQLVGVPAFIVGAGPSLAKNAELLREATAKGVVFSTNSSGRVLARHGIEPQIFCCIESVDVSPLVGSVPFVDRSIRAFSLSAHPRTFRTGKGPLFPVWEGIPELCEPLERLTGLPGLAVSGSVSTLAFSLAYAFGCSPIVLVGQDLAYTGNRTHAEGSPFDASRVEVCADGQIRIDWCPTSRGTRSAGDPPLHAEERLEEVPAWGGVGTVPSGQSFAGPRAWLSGAAHSLRQLAPHVALVNATEGGSRIDGFDERPLAGVLASLEGRGPTVDELCQKARTTGRRVAPEALSAWARDERERVRRVRDCARRTRGAAKRALVAIEGDSPDAVTQAFERLSTHEIELKAAASAAPMVNAWAFADIEAAMREDDGSHGEDSHRSAVTAVRREVALTRAIEGAARRIADRLTDLARGGAPAHLEPTTTQGEPDPCRL
ncbi:MAG: DUF115 domain-containing protein [Polyangiaceae bacterium]|nr:DUF115 domain-containing protein [Polyangiaceae bacterium]